MPARFMLLAALLALSTAQASTTPGAAYDPTKPLNLWNLENLNGKIDRIETTTASGTSFTRYNSAGTQSTTVSPSGRESSNSVPSYARASSIDGIGNNYDNTGCRTGEYRAYNNQLQYTCDNRGREVTASWSASVSSGGRVRSSNLVRKTTYSSDGRTATSTTTSTTTSTDVDTGETGLSGRSTITYSANGFIVLQDIEMDGRRSISQFQYTYDTQGNWVSRTRYDYVDGQYMPVESIRRVFKYL